MRTDRPGGAPRLTALASRPGRAARSAATAVVLLTTLAMPGLAQEELLRSGPMVGYSTMREVMLWVQTSEAAEVQFEYWDVERPERRHATESRTTRRRDAFTTKMRADSLEPGRRYRYRLLIDGREVERPYPLTFQTQELWQWRRDPPPFTIALGSCAFVNEKRYDRPNEGYGGHYEIFRAIHEKRPDAMLWLGDNVYLREADWNSRFGVHHRYSHTRSLDELQPLLASTHHYAIWDDHDFGPNNSDRSFWNKEVTLETFRLFWPNPAFGVDGEPGITTTFQWADVQFFLLDNRYHRTPNVRRTGEKTMLGEKQFRWLIDALVSSEATFKIVAVGGQVLNPYPHTENYSAFPAERKRLLDRIREEDVPGVVFLSGDRHRTEITRLERSGSYPLYDFTISPLTSSPYEDAAAEPNYLRVPGTLLMERNFAIMRVDGPREDRRLTVTVYDKAGEELWSETLRSVELR